MNVMFFRCGSGACRRNMAPVIPIDGRVLHAASAGMYAQMLIDIVALCNLISVLSFSCASVALAGGAGAVDNSALTSAAAGCVCTWLGSLWDMAEHMPGHFLSTH